jgi:hypothetical protein
MRVPSPAAGRIAAMRVIVTKYAPMRKAVFTAEKSLSYTLEEINLRLYSRVASG